MFKRLTERLSSCDEEDLMTVLSKGFRILLCCS